MMYGVTILPRAWSIPVELMFRSDTTLPNTNMLLAKYIVPLKSVVPTEVN